MTKSNARTTQEFWRNGYHYPKGYNLQLDRIVRDEWLQLGLIELIGEVDKKKKPSRKRDAKGHFLPIVRTG